MRRIFFRVQLKVLATRNKECMDRRHFLVDEHVTSIYGRVGCFFYVTYRWHSNTSNLGSFTFCI